MIKELKHALGFAVTIGSTLVTLYLYIMIYINDEVIVLEPSRLILSIEIIITLAGLYFAWQFWHRGYLNEPYPVQ